MERAGELFGILGDLVHCHNLAAHIHRLGESDGAEEHIVYVVGQRIFREPSHLFGHILPARPLYGGAVRTGHKIERISVAVKCLDRKILVGIKHRYAFLIICVASGKVYCGQIRSKRLLLLVAGCLDALSGYAHLLVVAHSHRPARIKRHHTITGYGL